MVSVMRTVIAVDVRREEEGESRANNMMMVRREGEV